uniref:receptor protein-tyrosine kinase n=1 Tax=Cynoglossus semilaevis TaxID=244447 RepID=A0A3P8UL87_CYNSE
SHSSQLRSNLSLCPAVTSCDFESQCLWTLSNHSDQSDWLLVSPRQPQRARAGEMPVTDHSEGDTGGHFLLLTPSSAAEVSGSCQYHITSPVLPGSNKHCSLHVALFESQPALGNLTLLIKPILTYSDVQPVALRSHRSPEWEVLEISIGEVDEPFQVTLVYTSCLWKKGLTVALDSLELLCIFRGPDHQDGVCGEYFHCVHADVCIDPSDVCNFHTDCPYGEDEGFLCALPSGSHCSFERDACGWSVSNQQSGWRRVAGDELLERKDMQGAALQSTPGYFLFLGIRESNPVRGATIQSQTFPPPVSLAPCQLHFSLYVHGDFNGSVLLSIEENGTSSAPLVWERKGHLLSVKKHQIKLPVSSLCTRFHMKVTAVWSQGSNADVALDDIAIGASCFSKGERLMTTQQHNLDLIPLPEPSASEVSLMTWWFNSCGASGPHGPTQAQCDSTYRNKNVSVTVGKDGHLKGVQMWKVPATNKYLISAYGAAGGKGAKNHNKRNHGVFISAIFPLEKGETLYILVGHQGEDACPGRNPQTQKICLGEWSVIEDELRGEAGAEWAGGGGGGGGATYIFKMENGEMVPLLIAAGGGGNAYLEDPESSLNQIPLEQYENSTVRPSTSGRTGAAGGGGGWKDTQSPHLRAGKSLVEGAEGGSSCPLALSKLDWTTFGGFGGGGGACTAGGGGGGFRGGDAALTDEVTADGQNGVSFVHPMGEIFLQPLAAMESHGECEIKVQLNCSHCQTQSCRRDEETHLLLCLCDEGQLLASDNITCVDSVGMLSFHVTNKESEPRGVKHKVLATPKGPAPQGQMSTLLVVAVVVSTIASGVALVCASVILMWYRRKNDLHAVRGRLQSPEYKLSKIRSSTIMTDYNPNYCFAGKAASLSELKEVPRKNITLLRALGHGAFGEVYEGQVLGMTADNGPMQVAIKTLPEICSEQDEMDFLMEALIMSKFSHENIVRCVGVSLNILPRFILLELMTGGDMKSFLRHNRPRAAQSSSLTMGELLQMARDIACGCRYLEENHFIHRDIAARNCLLTCPGPDRVAKIGDFGMARDIYRFGCYVFTSVALLSSKALWVVYENGSSGILCCDSIWSFGVLLWEILSLGYMPYPCKTNQEVLEFVTSGGRMDPPKGCPGPVYRIMTQCWQHCPEHRPNFSTILERINYCTQDPDVINTPLPVEYGPNTEEDGGTLIRSSDHTSTSLTPLMSSHPVSQDSPTSLDLCPPLHLPHQPTKPQLLLQRIPPVHHEVTSCHEVLQQPWANAVSAAGVSATAGGHWHHAEPPHHRPCSRNSSSAGSQRLKNNTKNLWNPTYGSWVLENFRGKKTLAHTQSMPLSSSASSTTNPTHPGSSNLCSSSASSPSCQLQAAQNKNPPGGASKGAIDLAKLQSFPCGKVNYAYDDQSYVAESLPVVNPKPSEAITNTRSVPSVSSGTSLGLGFLTSSSCVPKLLLKRHASYGHEDVKRHTKAEKPTRDRDSGFSLSEDLSVTPI